MEPWIDYDVDKIKKLREEYQTNLDFLRDQLPEGLNLESPEKIKKYFRDSLEINLQNVKISYISKLLDHFDTDSQEYDFINGLVLYLKLRFTIRNYLDCILRHQNHGRVNLRLMAGQWVMPNRQPISSSPEIIACETGRNGV